MIVSHGFQPAAFCRAARRGGLLPILRIMPVLSKRSERSERSVQAPTRLRRKSLDEAMRLGNLRSGVRLTKRSVGSVRPRARPGVAEFAVGKFRNSDFCFCCAHYFFMLDFCRGS
jgi:hypothetical protein